jgi:hypothetical protein
MNGNKRLLGGRGDFSHCVIFGEVHVGLHLPPLIHHGFTEFLMSGTPAACVQDGKTAKPELPNK